MGSSGINSALVEERGSSGRNSRLMVMTDTTTDPGGGGYFPLPQDLLVTASASSSAPQVSS